MSRDDCPLSPGERVWGYARDSGGDKQELSVPQQEQVFNDYCERFGLTLLQVFKDEARPGKTVIGRDAFDDLMYLSRGEPRPVDGIIVWSFSRFARNLKDAQFHKADLRRRGYELISMSDDLPDGDYALIIEALIDWKNERFLKDLSRDIKRGLHNLIRQGYSRGGRVPVGYKAEKVVMGKRRDGRPHVVSRWVPDPETADLVRLAFRMRANGATLKQIDTATHLYDSGHGRYSGMFRNESYRGVLKFGDLRKENAFEPIIDEETWEAVQALNRANKHKLRKRRSYLLSGMVKCALCGAAMTGCSVHVGRTRYLPYYRCGRELNHGKQACPAKYVNGRVLDRAILEAVVERVVTKEYATALAEEASALLWQGTAGLDRKINHVKQQLAEVERAMENLLDLAERHGAEAAAARLLEREAEREELAKELQGLERERETRTWQVGPEMVEAMLTQMCKTRLSDELQVKHVLLKRFVARVEASTEIARLIYTFPVAGTT